METQDYSPESEIKEYWLVLKRRWPLVAAVIIASVGLSGLALFLRKPEYQATGMLLFKSDRTSSLTKVGEKIGDLESVMREGNPLQTQAIIVNSRPILSKVIDDLHLKDEQGKNLDPESLKIKVEPILGTDILSVTYLSRRPDLAASVINQVMKAYVENNTQSKREQVFAAGEFINKQLPQTKRELENAAEALRSFKTQNKTIQLTEEATTSIRNIAQIDADMNQAQTTLADLSTQETQIRNELKLSGQEPLEVASLSQIPGVQDILGELQKVQTKLVTEKARYTDEHPTVVNLKNQEANLNALLISRVKQVSGSQKTEQVLGAQQKISLGKLQIGKIKEDLVNQFIRLQAQRQGLQSKIKTLSSLRANYKQRVEVLPYLEKQQGYLDRSLLVAQKNYENLMARLEEIQVAERQTIGNAKVIQFAEVPKEPFISKIILLLAAAGIFGGLTLGLASAFFVDVIDKSLKTVKEAERLFGYTLIGLIPAFETKNKLAPANLMKDGISDRVIVETSPPTVIHKAYQMLQANLKFSRYGEETSAVTANLASIAAQTKGQFLLVDADTRQQSQPHQWVSGNVSHKQARKIVITSSMPGEGKSEVAANLAAVLAQTERRVLLVDADMRQPSQHHIWGLIDSVGLSDVIVNREEFFQCKQTVTKNLSVLTAGILPSNPLALIDCDRMSALIELFSQSYDYIVFDTPPLAGAPDAAVLGRMVDGVLLVVRPGVVNSASANAAKLLLERSEANILGIIANGVNIKKDDSYFYY
jgi:polysaccharide biosynthesis transport protein